MSEGREWFSTAGAALPPEEAQAATGVVELRRVTAPGLESLPETFSVGAGCTAVTAGKNEANPVVVDLNGVSDVQCQFAMRSFRLPKQEKVHQALFLRDVSSEPTLVNGIAAFRPWHWIQDGDAIGIRADASPESPVANFLTAHYVDLRKLPAALVVLLDGDAQGEPLVGDLPGGGDVGTLGQSQGRAGAVHGGADHRGRGRPRKRRRFGKEVVGKILDITYTDPAFFPRPTTFRAKVEKFNRQKVIEGKKTDIHYVHSRGLSTWDDESWDDEIDLNKMYDEGLVSFVDGSDFSESESLERRPKKQGRF